MGNNLTDTSIRSSSSISDLQDSSNYKSKIRHNKSSEILQQSMQSTRQQMIDTWVNLILSILKKKARSQKDWKKTCDRISEAIQDTNPSSYWKVFSVTDSLASKDSICTYPSTLEMRANQINKQEKTRPPLRRAKSIMIDITSLGKKISTSKRNRQRPQSHEPSELQDIREIKKNIGVILQHQFNQSYHPFSIIKRIFIQDLGKKYNNVIACETLAEDSQTLQCLTKDFVAIVMLELKSCQIYKQWIQYFTNLKDKGYNRFMFKTIINSFFDPPSELHSFLYKVLKITNSHYIANVSKNLRQNVNVKKFGIKSQLEIQGNYIKSMIMLSDIDKITHPRQLLKFFQTLKSQIQHDVQFFNQTFGKVQETTIDGDNLLSILCFILCRMKSKLGDIHAQILLLHVVYGDNILIEHDTVSYMVTAMEAAIDYLKSEQFVSILKQ